MSRVRGLAGTGRPLSPLGIGRKTLGENPSTINVKYLERFPEFVKFRSVAEDDETPRTVTQRDSAHGTPEEVLEATHSQLKNQVLAEIVDKVKALSPRYFTTSDFTAEAKEFVRNIDARIILISGRQLAEFMWEHGIGLSTAPRSVRVD